MENGRIDHPLSVRSTTFLKWAHSIGDQPGFKALGKPAQGKQAPSFSIMGILANYRHCSCNIFKTDLDF